MDSLNGEAKNCSRNFLNAFQSNKGHKCSPTYHIFKKKITTNKKTTHKWYYFWNDPVTGKMYQRVCKGCKTQAEAYAFISALPPLFAEENITIAKIAEWMYVPGGPHLERLAKLGIVYTPETINSKRFKLNIIVEQFGNLEIQDLTIPLVTDYLTADGHSGSWKNEFLTVIGEVYSNAPFCGTPYIPIPAFPKFRRNSKKKDIFTTEELNIFFNERLWLEHSETKYQNFPQFDEGHKAMYLLFLCCVKLGLRIGEGIGIRTNQFLFDERAFVVDGFWKANQLYRTTYNKCGSEEEKKIRVVLLPEDLARIMRNYISDMQLGPEDFVFQRYGKPIRKWLAEQWFRDILGKSGIEVGKRVLTPHSLRYTYITRMRRNVAGETVQKIAGHSLINMTDHYTRADISGMVTAIQPAADAANELFK